MMNIRFKFGRFALYSSVLAGLSLGVGLGVGCGDNAQLISASKDAGDGTKNPGNQHDAGGTPTDPNPDDATSNNGPVDPPGDGDFSTVGYSLKMAEALCERLFDCGAQSETLRNQMIEDFEFLDVEGCYEALSREFYRAARPAVLSVDEGRQGHSQENAAACISTVKQAECAQIIDDLDAFSYDGIFEPSGCAEIAIPGQGLDEDCLTRSECADADTFCDGGAYSPTGATTGTCAKLAGNGEYCAGSNNCQADLYCDLSSGECDSLPGVGDACTGFCGSTLVCSSEDVCEELGGPNTDCQYDDECAAGLACSYASDKCEPLAGPGDDCEDLPCQPGLSCEDDGDSSACKAPAGTGESCASSSNCAIGLICTANQCAAPKRLDETCDADNCAWYATCASSGRCELADSATLDGAL